MVITERSHSGLVRSLGKRVYRKVSWVQIPPSPQRNDSEARKREYITLSDVCWDEKASTVRPGP